MGANINFGVVNVKKILSVILAVIMILWICPVMSFAEERNDYDCIDGYEHTTNNGQCEKCSAFVLEEGATMRLKITLVGLYSTSWALVEGNAIIIDSGSSSFSNFSSGYFETYPWVTIKGEKAGTDVLLLFANDSLYTTGQIVVIPHQTHISFETINGIWATCTESGLTDGLKCTYCGEVVVEQEEIPALGHTEEVLPTKPATCTETGLTEGEKCSVCGEIFVAQEIIPATGHDYNTEVIAPTCTEQGYTIYSCDCGFSDRLDYVNATGHDYKTEVIAPTCTEQGYTIYSCDCGFSDRRDYVEATGHDYNTEVIAPTCTEKGYTIYSCDCGFSDRRDYVNATGHDYKTEVIASTCTEIGYTIYTCDCGFCDRRDYINPKGHDYKTEVIAPTCTEQGYTIYSCDCGFSDRRDYVLATGHTPGEWEVVAEAQVDAEGKEQQKCTACGELLDERIIPALVPEYTPGDANGDGKVNAADARIVLRISAQLEKVDKYSQPFEAFDVNGDGKINASDARKVLRISAKLEI